MASNTTKSESQIEMDLKKKLHNELFEFLVCQNCEEVPKMGPIFTCNSVDSHATCNDCFLTLKVCKCKANINHRSKAYMATGNPPPKSRDTPPPARDSQIFTREYMQCTAGYTFCFVVVGGGVGATFTLTWHYFSLQLIKHDST
jgi:hypothetical protein